ncbi:hypothetical protein [Planomonospora venezuelensis]|uniref:Integral membrane protein n=1 Tax=Planomonospora venezuelensis TaxID=1999 RepID=A0A841D888_PLAVE|nr:hypothetical protein [Planomonospora venezuelensis]MBB5963626.1 hypothetical protein [Planomonospora venezuelensis]GIN01414.1 hypothetical protein Pve01_30720 [Planomonospora venezuelensis]
MPTPRFFPFLRAAIALQAAMILIQAVTAGLLLSSPGGRTVHGISAVAVLAAGLLHLAAAILVWRPGGGPARTVAPAAGLLIGTLAEMAFGVMHLKTLHVPVGVLMFGGSVMLLARVMPRRRAETAVAA